MYDLPEHLKIGLTVDNKGPADPPDPNFHHWGCWCGDPECKKWDPSEDFAERTKRIQHDHNVSLPEAMRVARAEVRLEERKRVLLKGTKCSNPDCPLEYAHSGPCAPKGWMGV